jgi:ABC-2 type transport system ATP-binding protein
LIRQLASEGTTVLVSSHILTELAEMCDQVGIIERGKLLAVGSVAEIYNSMQAASQVRMRLLGRVEELLGVLATHEEVSSVQRKGDWIQLELRGDAAAQASLLRWIVSSGFDVLEYVSHRESLEDVFMKVTTGAVQ